jgi:hypothetical protein
MEGVEKWGTGASVLPLWSSVSRICQSEEERVGVSGTGRVKYKSENGKGNVVRYFWNFQDNLGFVWSLGNWRAGAAYGIVTFL